MARTGFWVDMSACAGCRSCQAACAEEHGLRPGEHFRRVALVSAHSDGEKHFFSAGCNHCEQPACVAACPTGAMYRDEAAGLVLHEDGKCIACGSCVWNCPYGAASFSRVSGLAQKCDACARRRGHGLCVACEAACPTGALRFGDLEDLGRRFGGGPLVLPVLPPPTLTHPSVRLVTPHGEDQ